MIGHELARQRAFAISDSSGVAEARRYAASLATALEFDEASAGPLKIAVTEAATNILKHAGRGEIVMRIDQRESASGVEVVALDKGPGIANLAESMRDGHSTAGSPGTGLGALQRMTSGFEVWSHGGNGTLARFTAWYRAPAAPDRLPLGAINTPKQGEEVSGDGWVVVQGRGSVIVFVVDGLGHGPEAATAARTAVDTVKRSAHLDAVNLMDAVHSALRPTRGAAAAVLLLQAQNELCTFCGVGNISASIRGNGSTRSMVSHNGILGHQVRKMQEFSYPFPQGSLAIAHSDGVATSWDLAKYPGLASRHPSLVAAALYRDFSRGRDDLTVVALKNGPA